jgi:hypothetical protein
MDISELYKDMVGASCHADEGDIHLYNIGEVKVLPFRLKI